MGRLRRVYQAAPGRSVTEVSATRPGRPCRRRLARRTPTTLASRSPAARGRQAPSTSRPARLAVAGRRRPPVHLDALGQAVGDADGIGSSPRSRSTSPDRRSRRRPSADLDADELQRAGSPAASAATVTVKSIGIAEEPERRRYPTTPSPSPSVALGRPATSTSGRRSLVGVGRASTRRRPPRPADRHVLRSRSTAIGTPWTRRARARSDDRRSIVRGTARAPRRRR